MSKTIALLRRPDPAIAQCELTHMNRNPIDFSKVLAQHQAYAEALTSCGVRVEMLPELKNSGDAVFVEDTAVVLDELAIICRPGAASRAHEIESAANRLSGYRKIVKYIQDEGKMDGGDIMLVEKTLYVGLSTRTNAKAAQQLENYVQPHGYGVKTINVEKSLHLKTSVSYLGQNTLLINPRWLDVSEFRGFKLIEVDPTEDFGANALRLENEIIYSAESPKTAQRMIDAGFTLVRTSISELAKAEAGLTCLSLIFKEV